MLFHFFFNNIINNKNIKLVKKELNISFPNNRISNKHIYTIINKNNHCFLCSKYTHNNYKINNEIEKFIIDSINNNNCLVAKDIKNLISEKFKLDISLTSVYNILKKNNYIYKKTKININPHTFDDQKQQLLNVHTYLNNNNNDNKQKISNMNDEDLIKLKNNIENENLLIKKQIDLLKNMKCEILTNIDYGILNSNIKDELEQNNELVSIDEMSIITNRASSYGWSLKNKDCVINIPYLKPNVRYSLLMATSKNKIIKYVLVKGSIKSEQYMLFMKDLNKNKNYSYLIDNASIHKSKKAKQMYKDEKMNVIYNAPYQSQFNPIEMVFSLLRKQLNKKIVKTNSDIEEVINKFIEEIKNETLKNIFNHSEKILKEYLKI